MAAKNSPHIASGMAQGSVAGTRWRRRELRKAGTASTGLRWAGARRRASETGAGFISGPDGVSDVALAAARTEEREATIARPEELSRVDPSSSPPRTAGTC